jgi:parallel beta-helix repeat protein
VLEVKPGASVADALRAVASGGTVLLDAGTHKGATVGATAWTSTVTLRPAPGAEGQVSLGELNLTDIRHLDIAGVSTRGLVTINGGSDISIAGSRPLGVLVKGDASEIDISGNTITGGWNGVTVQSWMGTARPHDVRIVGNTITGQENDNVQVGIANDITVEGNVLADPQENDNHNDGVQFMGGSGLIVRGNRISGQDQGLMFKPEPTLGADSAVVGALVENNVISRTRGFGVILVDTTRTTLRSNTVYDTPKQSVLFTGANTGAVVVGNVVQTLYVERTATAPALQSGNCIASGATVLDLPVAAHFVDQVDYQLAIGDPCAGRGSLLG